MRVFPAVIEELKKQGAEDVLLFGGGIIPDDDAAQLLAMGVDRLFGPGTHIDEVVEYLEGKKGK